VTDIRTILAERGKTHGDYAEHAEITQKIKMIMHSRPIWLALAHHERETLDMIAHKIGRVLAGNPHFEDHWRDIAGYATLSADRNNLSTPTEQ
jgi:hypothetical protein